MLSTILMCSFSFIFLSNMPQPTSTGQLREFTAEHEKNIVRLITSAHAALSKQPRTHAESLEATVCVSKLALLRSPNAVKFLVANISFNARETEKFVGPLPTLRTTYPCVYALGEIGPPAFPDVLRLAESDERESIHFFCALVFRRSLGREQAIAYLNCHAGSLKNSVEKKRIESVARLVREGPAYLGSEPDVRNP